MRKGCILGQALKDYPGVQVGANVYVFDLDYADDSVILTSSFRGMQSLLEAVNRYAAAIGMRTYASKTKVTSALIPGEQRQAVLLDGPVSIRSRRGITLRSKGRIHQAVVRSISLYGCETWPVRVAHERMLEVFDNDSIRRIQHVWRIDCEPSVELRRRQCSCKEGSAGLVVLQDVPKLN